MPRKKMISEKKIVIMLYIIGRIAYFFLLLKNTLRNSAANTTMTPARPISVRECPYTRHDSRILIACRVVMMSVKIIGPNIEMV